MTAPVCPECGGVRIRVFYAWATYDLAEVDAEGSWEDGEQRDCGVDYFECADCGHQRQNADTFHPDRGTR